jgi:hypothetical protein
MRRRAATSPRCVAGVRREPALLGSIAGDAFFIRFAEQAHGTFNALEGLIPALHGIRRAQPWSRTGPEAIRGHATICRHVLRLVAHYLDGGRTDPFAGQPPEAGVEIAARRR